MVRGQDNRGEQAAHKERERSVAFVSPEEGETRGLFVADADTYGASKLWVVVERIPLDVDSSGSSPDDEDDDDDD